MPTPRPRTQETAPYGGILPKHPSVRMFGPKSSLFSDVTGPSHHLVAATAFKPRAHGCYLPRIVRSHEPAGFQ
jgi:hypothetical protein